ncbi:MAG: DegT/DnrJ/EryC1/StrS family aminotransferase [Fibrobacteres bacterium]|nr:DegT/DnrJ/EryC1/StrS family aminotransferase [Fibrobacterota bacterium]
MTPKLAAFFQKQDSDVFLFAKGRVALYALLKAIGIGKGDEVICSGYTCVMVPSAPKFLGAVCRYADIDPQTYNISMHGLEKAYTHKVKAVIVQHTYGIAQNMDEIAAWAFDKGIPVIEDCCHAFGSRWKGQLCGTFGIGSFFSGQWNKPFSTGLGGILLVNDDEVLAEVQALYASILKPSDLEETRIGMQIRVYNALVNPRTVSIITRAYRMLSRMGLAIGSSSNDELAGEMPRDYFKSMAAAQIEEGTKNLANIDKLIAHRKTITGLYDRELANAGFQPLRQHKDADNVILRYPVRVADKKELLEKALKKGVEIGSWFEIPLHPEGTDMQKFGYTDGMCPEAEKACREVVNLPTHLKIDESEAVRVIDFLRRFARSV